MLHEKEKTNKSAFTLAEVLIVLAVIGVIAALCIPALIQSNNDAETIAKVKQTQSILSEAMKKYTVDNSCIGNLSNCNAFDNGATSSPTTVQASWDKIKSYFNIAKDCGTSTSLSCFPNINYRYLKDSLTPNINYESDDYEAKAVLANGMIIAFHDYGGNCIQDRSEFSSGPISKTCGVFDIDINGKKGPNQIGRDLFSWYIAQSGVYAFGTLEGETSYSKCDPSAVAGEGGWGYGCSGKILKENEIKY